MVGLMHSKCRTEAVLLSMSGDAEVSEAAPPLSLSILEITRSAQLQHGLRHGDHGRYRRANQHLRGPCPPSLPFVTRQTAPRRLVCRLSGARGLMPNSHRRQYCTRRLRRVYKGVKLLHGRGKYVKRQLDPATVTDARCHRWLAIRTRHAARHAVIAAEFQQPPHDLLVRIQLRLFPVPCICISGDTLGAGTCKCRWCAPSAPGRWRWS